jgi:hypothetical protein
MMPPAYQAMQNKISYLGKNFLAVDAEEAGRMPPFPTFLHETRHGYTRTLLLV